MWGMCGGCVRGVKGDVRGVKGDVWGGGEGVAPTWSVLSRNTERIASVPISQQREVAMALSKDTLARPIPHSS